MSDSKDVLSRRGLLGGVQKDFQVVPRQVDIKNDSPEECAPGEGSQSWDVDGVVSDESLCESELHTLIIGREAMACRFDVVFNAGEYPQDTQWALAALDLIDVIESRLSVYRASSELTLLNQNSSQNWQTVADDLYGLLEQCRSISTATGGTFDAATGSLIRLWGFLERQGRTPTKDALEAARESSGMHLVQMDPIGKRIRFKKSGVEFNLGAIGKGWAIDRAIDLIAGYGVRSVLIHGGASSVRAMGCQGPQVGTRRGWRVGLRDPLRPARRLATFTLVDRALGTSGSGTQFFVDRGKRMGHILDPRTGQPAEGVISATVLAPTASESDALATALYTCGPQGLARIAPRGGNVSAIMVIPSKKADRLRVLLANVDRQTLTIEAKDGVDVIESA